MNGKTVSTIASFFLTMMLYPEVQRKAQAHIKKVVGSDRLPQFSDRKDLPYIDCIVFEILRWKPTVPLGFAHTSMEDDVYKGYLIPKGTTVLPNIWSVPFSPSIVSLRSVTLSTLNQGNDA